MPGRGPHYVMDGFSNAESARLWMDPQSELVWEECDDGGNAVLGNDHHARDVADDPVAGLDHHAGAHDRLILSDAYIPAD